MNKKQKKEYKKTVEDFKDAVSILGEVLGAGDTLSGYLAVNGQETRKECAPMIMKSLRILFEKVNEICLLLSIPQIEYIDSE